MQEVEEVGDGVFAEQILLLMEEQEDLEVEELEQELDQQEHQEWQERLIQEVVEVVHLNVILVLQHVEVQQEDPVSLLLEDHQQEHLQ
jgi:phospholipid N-methyltransferase